MINYLEKSPYREDYFLNYYYLSMHTYDCDPAMYMLDYVCRRLELNIEQRYWLSWIYANTYNVASAWVIWNEFPDFELVDQERLEKWNKLNVKRIHYQNDVKWNKGYLAEMFKSYHSTILTEAKNQNSFFQKYLTKNEINSFNILYDLCIKKFYKFGRYTTWFYLQTLREICGLSIQPGDLRLSDNSSYTQRAALEYIQSKDEIAEQKHKKYSKEEINQLENKAISLLEKIKESDLSYKANYDLFNMETVLCAFKKTFRTKNGRYIGYYHDRCSEDILKMQKMNWDGIDWNLLWDARKEMIPAIFSGKKRINKKLMEQFVNTGIAPVIQNKEQYCD